MELAASEATGTLTLESSGAVTDSGTLTIRASDTATGQDVSSMWTLRSETLR